MVPRHTHDGPQKGGCAEDRHGDATLFCAPHICEATANLEPSIVSDDRKRHARVHWSLNVQQMVAMGRWWMLAICETENGHGSFKEEHVHWPPVH